MGTSTCVSTPSGTAAQLPLILHQCVQCAGKAAAPEGDPDFRLDSCTITVDEENATRFTLDTGSALYQLKVDDAGAREALVTALGSVAATAADVLRARQQGRQYPERVNELVRLVKAMALIGYSAAAQHQKVFRKTVVQLLSKP